MLAAMDERLHAKIDAIFHAALERPADERSRYLAEACGGDADLLREVRQLLSEQDETATTFLDAPAAALQAGALVGPYRITGALGAGGMGAVYRAEDTRLGRTVAIKFIRAGAAVSPAMRERFEREARVIAALNHPHICAVYDVGTEGGAAYLVMEHIEGETLAARLKRGPLAFAEA